MTHLLFYAPNQQTAGGWRDLLVPGHVGLRFSVWTSDMRPDELSDVDVLLAYSPPAGLAARCPSLKAIFSLAVGVDHLLSDPQLPDLPIVRMHDPQVVTMVTEYVLAAVWRHHRSFDVHEQASLQGQWCHQVPRVAGQTRLGILGAGSLGQAAARALVSCGFEVAAWSRTRKDIPGVLSWVGPDGLQAMAAQTDILVCMLPGTPSTRGLIGAALLAQLKPGACVVNVGRGHHVDASALLSAIEAGQVRAATLDVFNVEPLPADSPLWRHPQVLVTPHVGSFSTPETAAPHVIDNLRRLASGQALVGVVDPSQGY